jgi:hypothetical protein
LKLTDDQKKQVGEMQWAADGLLAKVLSEDQKKQFKEMRNRPGPGGPGSFAPPPGSSLFRVYRYGPDYPGLAGKDLTPGKTLEELQPKEPEKK